MIVPMKKIYLVVEAKNQSTALEGLRDVGLVHVVHVQPPVHQDVEQTRQHIQSLEQCLSALEAYRDASARSEVFDWPSAVNEVLELVNQTTVINEQIKATKALIELWRPWGPFEPNDVRMLAHHGIHLKFFEIPVSEWKKYSSDPFWIVVSQQSSLVRAITITRGHKEYPFQETAVPEAGLHVFEHRLRQEEARQTVFSKRLKELARGRDTLEKALIEKRQELELNQIKAGLGIDEGLVYLKGFCPVNRCEDLKKHAQAQHWGLLVTDLSDEDRPPTLLRNPKWVQMIKPVFDLINVLPGYNEVDISPVFLIFFSIFFGILIGDAGYGLVFFGLTAFLHIKLKDKVKDKAPFFLVYVLSSSAIVWGVLTGTFFGTLLLGKVVKPVLQWVTDSNHVQLLCFLIGAIHLSIARGWQLLLKTSTPFAALAEFGWIVVVWGGFFLANAMVIGIPLMGVDIAKSLIIVGAGVGLVFVDIVVRSKGKVGDIGVGCILLFFSVLSACTDVVSYIRLFAVGLAGLAVADAFNEMALGIGFNSVLTGLITVLILVAGHLFNIVLCCFGLLVHGLRLNVLEFSGHLGLEWKGFKYQPFQKTNVVSTF